MQKFNPTAVNHLLSFDRADQIAKMNNEERLAFNNQIKKQAAYFMLSVSRAVQSKDYKTAKSILIYIADSCSCIQDPDSEVKYLIQVCCQHLAFIHEMQTAGREQRKSPETKSEVIQSDAPLKPIYVFKYNKFKGQFECDDDSRDSLNQTVLFYMSKLNAILFQSQNTENQHSILAMLKTYYPFFIMVLVLMVVLFIIVFSGIISVWMGLVDGSFESQIPIIIVCSLFLFPLIKIYRKEPVKKNSVFFEKRLGEQILKINKLCAQKGQKIKFFMPQGIEINVQVDQERQSES